MNKVESPDGEVIAFIANVTAESASKECNVNSNEYVIGFIKPDKAVSLY